MIGIDVVGACRPGQIARYFGSPLLLVAEDVPSQFSPGDAKR
jgi:hypothetical protein